jgi:hypothetical protein
MGLLLVWVNCTWTQEYKIDYSALTIPDSVKKDVHAIVRLDDARLDIESPSKYTFKAHQVVTLLDAEASDYAHHSFNIDKFRKVDDVDIIVYNKLGEPVGKYGKKNFVLQSAFDGVSFVRDDKEMLFTAPLVEYPCTIEIKYKMNVSGYLTLPGSYMAANSPTQLFRYTIRVGSEMDIRHRSVNMQLTPNITTEGKWKIYTWQARDLAAYRYEPNGFEARFYIKGVEIAPNFFEYDGYKGSFLNWKGFGAWNYALYEDKKPFNDQRIAEIKQLVSTKPDIYSKVDVLYSYLKNNMRYVSIQLGIGGFKPFPVKFVDEKKYGDCKALTNYMRYMLAVAGIRSYPALINAGYNKYPADPEFPSDPFNHVILCVPNGKDSIWLECTSNTTSYINATGILGSFTENKNALLLTEEGGVLVKTPASRAENNLLITRNEIFVEPDGAAAVKSRIYATGDMSHLLEQIHRAPADKQKELFVEHLKFKNGDEFSFMSFRDSAAGFVASSDAFYEKLYEFKAGSKVFYNANIQKINDEDVKQVKERKTPYVFHFPYQKIDTTTYHFPQNISIEQLPPKKEIKDELVYYRKEFAYNPEQRTLTVVTLLSLKKNIIPPSHYNKLADAFSLVKKEEETKMILLHGELSQASAASF